MPKPFDPQETIPINRGGVAPWIFFVYALALLALVAGLFVWREFGREAGEPAPQAQTSPPVARETPPPGPPAPPEMRYARELAGVHTLMVDPPDEMLEEFNSLLFRAGRKFPMNTQMEIRDAVYAIHDLNVYNRSDIDVLKAARMLVDWIPPDTLKPTEGEAQEAKNEKPAPGSPPNATSPIGNIPVSRAVDAITYDIVSVYNEWVAAEWEAYYAEQEEIYQQRMDAAEREAAVRQAQEQAMAQAKAARDQAIMDQQRWRAMNSPAGMFWRLR